MASCLALSTRPRQRQHRHRAQAIVQDRPITTSATPRIRNVHGDCFRQLQLRGRCSERPSRTSRNKQYPTRWPETSIRPCKATHDRSNQSGEAETLVSPTVAERRRRIAIPRENDEQRCQPSELGPNPEAIAFGMDRPGIAVRGIAKMENRFEIAEAKADPGEERINCQVSRENEPAKIRREIGPGEFLG